MTAKTATKSAPATKTKALPKVAVLSAATEAQLIKFNHAKAMIKQFEVEKAAAEAEIYAALDGADTGMISGVERVSVSHRSRTNINGKLLKESFPEAYAATEYVSAYTVLTTK